MINLAIEAAGFTKEIAEKIWTRDREAFSIF